MKKSLLLSLLFFSFIQVGNLHAATEIRQEKPRIEKAKAEKESSFFQKIRKKLKIKFFKKRKAKPTMWTDKLTENLTFVGGWLSILLPVIGIISAFYPLFLLAYLIAIFTMILAVKMRRRDHNSGKVKFGFAMSIIILFFGTLLLIPWIVIIIYLSNQES